jgi:hypothetical protein
MKCVPCILEGGLVFLGGLCTATAGFPGPQSGARCIFRGGFSNGDAEEDTAKDKTRQRQRQRQGTRTDGPYLPTETAMIDRETPERERGACVLDPALRSSGMWKRNLFPPFSHPWILWLPGQEAHDVPIFPSSLVVLLAYPFPALRQRPSILHRRWPARVMNLHHTLVPGGLPPSSLGPWNLPSP